MRVRNNSTTNLDFAVLGKVKIGRLSEKGFPQSTDFFIFSPNQQNGNATYVEIAEKLYPHNDKKKRNRLPIIFSSDSEDNIENFLELRDYQGKVIAKTDNNTIEIAMTESLKNWYMENSNRIKTTQNKSGYLVLTNNDIEFGDTGQPMPPFEVFKAQLEAKAKKAAYIAKGGENNKDKAMKASDAIKWSERLIIRFVLVNFPVLGRWELSTKGTATSIGNIIASYDAVKNQRGTVLGTQWELKVDKCKSDRTEIAAQYPVLSIAPLITASDVNNGNLLIPSVNIHQTGLLLSSKEHHEPKYNVVEDVDSIEID